MTQQLMTFSRRGAPVKETTPIEALLRETTELSLRGSKIRPDFDFQEGLLPADIDKGQMGQVLETLGYEVQGVFDGVEAITAYNVSLEAGQPYDVVIMDLTVPGRMGGKEAVGRLRKLHAEARVIVSSGYSNDPVMANCQDYGFDAKVEKPVDIGELAQTLRTLLS